MEGWKMLDLVFGECCMTSEDVYNAIVGWLPDDTLKQMAIDLAKDWDCEYLFDGEGED